MEKKREKRYVQNKENSVNDESNTVSQVAITPTGKVQSGIELIADKICIYLSSSGSNHLCEVPVKITRDTEVSPVTATI
ncbi:hypothetical protein [Methanonatronarchaeum sp. AMET6-2]|uniref:hypothetical protein n=1 Tax=Methanonatronarchaeum sp. AMET6-2 TaxID=2933293 RepID=UPI001FF174A2|nr:hypothetical protein [Methanonatronarchaeum sp. AMET6-2]UOY10281.1 hypothetical protein MU439_01220 [Methanonatronarchaeum sp. AMET6-2]